VVIGKKPLKLLIILISDQVFKKSKHYNCNLILAPLNETNRWKFIILGEGQSELVKNRVFLRK
jgi:hypothetical protein